MLRSTGYLFPISPEQIEAFEALGLGEDAPDDSKANKTSNKKKKNNDS